jgi:ArsR family transcriptional regulator, zinc-responsive transcriptional repressor
VKGLLMAQKLELPPDTLLEEAAECLKVMAHPVRLKMVNILMQGEFAVHEIAELCDTSANQTCEHLRLLKGHGLLTSERRGRTVYYKILSPRLPRLIECISVNCGL